MNLTILSRSILIVTLVLSLAGCRTRTAGESSTQVGLSDDQIRDVLNRVAQRQLHPLKDGDYPAAKTADAVRAAAPPEGIVWTYPWGVALYGLQRTADVTGNQEFTKFVMEHNAICARYFAWLSELQKTPDLYSGVRNNKISGLMTLGNLDNCGAMGVQYVESMLRHPESVTPDQKAVAARIADWVLNKQYRLQDGTLARPGNGGGTVWPDDLYMGCPLIIRWAKFTGENKYLDDAASQIIHQAELQQDSDGLFTHGYNVAQQKPSPFKWGRGNGWVTVATVEVLSALPEKHPSRAKLIGILKKQIDGLVPLQTTNGMWRQVLDKPELWEETSCTAMFAYGIARAVNRGWIAPSYMSVARRAFEGVSRNVTADGSVNGTCIGTGIGQNLNFYITRPHPDNDMHGIGAVLLAGSEIFSANKRH